MQQEEKDDSISRNSFYFIFSRNSYQRRRQDLNMYNTLPLFTVLVLITSHNWLTKPNIFSLQLQVVFKVVFQPFKGVTQISFVQF